MKSISQKLNESIDSKIVEKFKNIKQQKRAIEFLYNHTNEYTKHLYRDTAWQNVQNVFKQIESLGVELTVSVKNGGYSQTTDGMAKSKTWNYEIEYTNSFGVLFKISGHLVAHSAGTVKDPWSAYDITVHYY